MDYMLIIIIIISTYLFILNFYFFTWCQLTVTEVSSDSIVI